MISRWGVDTFGWKTLLACRGLGYAYMRNADTAMKNFSLFLFFAATCLLVASPSAWCAVYYVATNGSNGANGLSTGTAWRTIGYAVNRVNAGDTVYVRGGEYREFVDCTNTRGRADAWITVQAYSNEIPVVKGSDVVTGWVQVSSAIWKKPNWALNPQQVFVNGNLLQQIGWANDYVSTNAFSCDMADYICIPYGHCCTEINQRNNPHISINGIEELVPYSFFYDEYSNVLYIKLNPGEDPAQKVVEASTRYGLFYMRTSVKFIRLSGLHFRHNNSFTTTLFGWPGVSLGDSCSLEDVDVQWCDAYGVSFCSNSKVLRSNVSNNGMDGLRAANVANVTISSCRITYNNYRNVTGNYVAGIKFHPDSGGIVETSEIAWNRSIGVWFDQCDTGAGIIIRNNRIHHNRLVPPCPQVVEWGAPGIFIEKSVNADVHDNLIFGNAISGIEFSGSSYCKIYNNTIAATYRPRGISPTTVTRAWMTYRPEGYKVIYNLFYNNLFAYNETEVDCLWMLSDDGVNVYGNATDYNVYYRHPNAFTSSPPYLGTLSRPSAEFCNYHAGVLYTNSAAWSAATGWDSHSIALNPLLRPSFHLATNSPCVNRGVMGESMNLTLDLDGNPRVAGAQIDVGAYELGPFLCDFQQNVWTGLYPLTVTFTGAGIGTNAETVWYGWDFDGDGEVDAEGVNLSCVTNVYPSAGDYTVGLYVSNSTGEAAQKIKPEAVQALVQYPPKPFSFRAIALTNNVTLRWVSPASIGASNALVCVRFKTNDYPATLSDGVLLTTTTNLLYTHTNLVSGTTYYYTIWVSHNGVNFEEP